MPTSVKSARLVVLLVSLVAVLPAVPAYADASVEDAIKSWVAAVDASPGWHASYAGLAADADSGTAALSGLTVTSDKPGFSLTVGGVKVEGFHPSSDPVLTADEIDLTDATLTVGNIAVTIPNAVIAAPMVPETGGFAWDPAEPVLSAIHALSALTTTAAASIKAPSVAVIETISGIDSDTTYQNVSVIGWRNGRIAATTAGPMRSVSPAKTPLLTLSAATAETRNVDLGALVAVLDPAAYANGTGDQVWRQIVGHTADHSLTVALPGLSFNVADIAADGIRLRQGKTAPSYAAAPADASASLLDHALHRLDELSNVAVDRLALNGIGGTIPGLADAHLDSLTMSSVEGEKIGDVALSGFAVGLASNAGSLKLAKFGLGGLALPTSDAVRKATATPGAVDYASLVPPIAYIETDGLDIAVPDVLTASLDRFRLDLGNYNGVIPKTVGLDLAAADLPVGLIPSDRVRDLFARFGYDRVHLDAAAHIDGAAPNEIAVKDFRLAIKDAGGVSGAADLVGSIPAGAADLKSALDALAVKSGTLTVTDDSIVPRLIGAQALRLKVDPEKFRQQFATGLPFMLMFLNNRDLQAKLTPALQGFIRNGGSLTAVASPSAPVMVAAIANAATSQPFTLFSLLATDVSGVPGPQPTAIPVLPAMAAAPQTTVPDTAAAAGDTTTDQSDDADQPDDSGTDDSGGAADQTGGGSN